MGDALDDKLGEKRRPPKRRRRWLSYSLRGLFVLVLLAALPAWWIRNQLDAFAAEHEAIELLRSQGATVRAEPAEPEWLWNHFPGGATPPKGDPRAIRRAFPSRRTRARDNADVQSETLTSRNELRRGDHSPLSNAPLAAVRTERDNAGSGPLMPREHATLVHLARGEGVDADMAIIARFTYLQDIGVENGNITDGGLAKCNGLRNLVTVTLDGCVLITDDGLRHLRHARKIESLRLNATAVGDSGIALVERFPLLKRLYAADTKIGNAGIAHIAALDRLEELNLAGTRGDDRGVGELARCVRLRRLWLPDGVTATGLAQLSPLKELELLAVTTRGRTPLAGFQKLEFLDVRIDGHDDGTALVEAASLPRLAQLSVVGDGITDATLLALAAIKQRCYVSLQGGRITPGGLRALLPILPDRCHVLLRETGLSPSAAIKLQQELMSQDFHAVQSLSRITIVASEP